jgi:hypothetical protein
MATIENSNSKRLILGRLLIAPMIFTVIAGISSIAHAQNERPESSSHINDSTLDQNGPGLAAPIEGSWIFSIDNLSQGTTFHSLVSITAGGVVVTSASLPTPSPFYGSWRQTGRNTFNVTFYTFIPDATGRAVATASVSLTLRLTSKNALTGTGVGHSCDLDAPQETIFKIQENGLSRNDSWRDSFLRRLTSIARSST